MSSLVIPTRSETFSIIVGFADGSFVKNPLQLWSLSVQIPV